MISHPRARWRFIALIGLQVLTVGVCSAVLAPTVRAADAPKSEDRIVPDYLTYVRSNVAARHEIEVFLNGKGWAQFDAELGYILGNAMPHDGFEKSATLSTVQANGARTSFMYAGRPCRINTYGDSFTQCHQVNDGETWQEYLAAHLGEPVRNFGMGGYGVYQAYRRMIREEQTDHAAEYLIFYLWGDDHVRSLLRCRYMNFREWTARQTVIEGEGVMFHGNFWPNVEMDLATGEMVEHESRVRSAAELFHMTDPDWMVENLRGDLALQMCLFKKGLIAAPDWTALRRLSELLHCAVDLDDPTKREESVTALLDAYSFAATKLILTKAQAFATERGKKLLVVLFDPNRVTRPLLTGGTRYDQPVVDFLRERGFKFFDMNLVHVADFKAFNLSVDDYYKRYFIGHYSPAGNHFFATAIGSTIAAWLEPKPIIYRSDQEKSTDFRGYLEGNN